MDVHAPTQGAPSSPSKPLSLRQRLPRWVPFLLLLVSFGYGLALAPTTGTGPRTLPDRTDPPDPAWMEPGIRYRLEPLTVVLDHALWRTGQGWQTADRVQAGIGYPYRPATFMVTLHNTSETPVSRHLVVSAPSMDHLEPAVIHPDGRIERLPVMGDRYPFSHRQIALPQWIWQVTLEPGATRVLVEVQNNGTTLLPLTLAGAEQVISHGASQLTWKAFVTGLLVFALVINLSITYKLQRPGLGWLSVFMASVLLSQLVMEGLGPWLIWPRWPEINALLGIALPLCLISICEFTPHFLSVGKAAARLLRGFSLLAGVHLVAAPLQIPALGQGPFLMLSGISGLAILVLVIRHFHEHVYGRYYAFSVLAIFIGAVISALRTIGWVPLNGLTNSAFFLGAAVGSLLLTSGVGRILLDERKRRLSADIRARQERSMRARIEQDYDRLLKTHRVTGKPNRAMLEEILEAIDPQQQPYSLCLVRLARFDELEQALGYRAAEDLLKQYLRQLNGFLKRTLGDRLVMINGYGVATVDTASHAFAFYRSPSPSQDAPVLETISDWLTGQFREGRFSFSWAASVGVAHAPEHGRDTASLLSSAGFAALDERQTLAVYDPAIADWHHRQQILMLDLEDALSSGEMWLEYQPKVHIGDHRVCALEALIRWHHSEFGHVSPERWIPLAEEVGVIHTVTRWALDRACRDYPGLKERFGHDLSIAVNISAKDLAQPRFHEQALAICRQNDVAPERLILEITETAMVSNPDTARQTIHQLRQAGFRIALDDFGAGHSSLGTLAGFELDELKIDRSFLNDLLCNPRHQKVLQIALDLGAALDLDVVVEGVEDEAVALWLQRFPDLYGQGYYWGRPFAPGRSPRHQPSRCSCD